MTLTPYLKDQLRLLSSSLLKTFMAEQILWRWFLGEQSLPSPQIAGILIKTTFLSINICLSNICLSSAPLVAQLVKNPPSMLETWVQSLG